MEGHKLLFTASLKNLSEQTSKIVIIKDPPALSSDGSSSDFFVN